MSIKVSSNQVKSEETKPIEQRFEEIQKENEHLKEKLQWHQRIINHLPHYYTFWKDTECRFLGCAEKIAKSAGYEHPEDMVGKSDYDCPWVDQAEHFQNIDQMVMRQNLDRYTVLEPQTQKKGETIWLSTTKVAINDEEGNVIGVVGVSDDVTEKLRREKLLRESEHRFRQLSEASFEGVTIHKDGIIIDPNQVLAEMFNYEAKVLMGMPISELIAQEYQETLAYHLKEGITQSFRAIGLKNPTPDMMDVPGRFDIEITLRNDPIQAISIRDITDQIKVEKIKDDFLANTSHELRTPLNGIIGIAESLIEGAAGPLEEQVKSNLSAIVSSGRRLYNLVNDILDYSQIRHQSLEMQLKPVDIRCISDIIITLSRPLIGEKNLVLINHIPEGIYPVEADEDRLQQILYNLVGNAIKFTAQGEVRIEAVELEDRVKISVSDTGIGVPNTRQKEIFESFQQADSSIKRGYGGSGLGLSISRQLVQLHGSELKVSSTATKGSTFYFSLPKSKSKYVKKPSSPQLPSLVSLASEQTALKSNIPIVETNKKIRPQGAGQTILVVDDEATNLRVIKNFLHLHNYKVITAQSGFVALDILKTNQPDLVILDIMMPRMDGYELCGLIRESHKSWQLPIIYLTAKNQVSDLVRGLSSGANDFLTKPFFQEELLIRVKTHISIKESIETLQENQQLKTEIDRRKKAELELDHAQKRLARILDMAENAIVAVNENHEIVYFNQRAGDIFGFEPHELVGKPVDQILTKQFLPKYHEIIDDIDQEIGLGLESKPEVEIKIKSKGGKNTALTAAIFSFELDDERIYTFILSESLQNVNKNLMLNAKIPFDQNDVIQNAIPTQLLQELFDKKETIRSMEGFFDNVIKYLIKGGTELLPQLREASQDSPQKQETTFLRQPEFRIALVDTMKLAVECWKTTTGKRKWELAEESQLWKVYLDQGVFKTRTLDKYLKLDKLPKHPKWNRVIDTVEYVLKQTPDPDHNLAMLLKNKQAVLFALID
jgi:PAS domain S-box-containing protein